MRSKLSSADYARLRKSFDGNEPIMNGGMNVAVERRPTRTNQTPEWMDNDAKVAEFIHKMFPRAGKFGGKCQCNPCCFSEKRLNRSKCRCRYCRDTMRAARWAVVICRWFRLGHIDRSIETDNQWKSGTVGSIVQKINRVLAGQRQDGRARTGKGRGRPKTLPKIDSLILQRLVIPAYPHAPSGDSRQ